MTFEKCENINDRFIETFPGFGGCSVTEKALLHYLRKKEVSYDLHKNEDGSMNHLITDQNEAYMLDQKRISRIYIVYGPLTKHPDRQEDYAVFISADGDVLAIIPRYAYFGF